jgi:ankyrin repeat protein
MGCLVSVPITKGALAELGTVLRGACSRGDLAGVQTVLNTIAEDAQRALTLNAADFHHGKCAVHVAAAGGHTACLRACVEAGADLSVRNIAGDLALHLAAAGGHASSLEACLVESKPALGASETLPAISPAAASLCDASGRHAGHISVTFGHVACLRVWLRAVAASTPTSQGALLDALDHSGRSIVHLCAALDCLECLEVCLAAGARADVVSRDGVLPVSMATGDECRRRLTAATSSLFDLAAIQVVDDAARSTVPK